MSLHIACAEEADGPAPPAEAGLPEPVLSDVTSLCPRLAPVGQRFSSMHKSTVRVLVVEDEPLFAEQLEMALLKMGHEPVGPAADARIALALHRTEIIDLALLDVQLRGGTDGVQLAGQLLAHRPIPLIFLTSRADDDTFARAQHLGPAAYLVKPLEPEALSRALALAVSNFSSQPPAAALSPLPYRPESTVPDALFVKENGLLEKIRLSDVQCVAAEGKFCSLTLAGRTVLVRTPFGELVRALPADRFVQIQRSYFVNLDHIERLDLVRRLVQVGKLVLPVGRMHFEELMRSIRTIG